MKTIGFFGDSFCESEYSSHSLINNYTTYILKIKNLYNLNIVNKGVGGSSIGDCIMLQFDPFLKENSIPDICVFVWTNCGRLFHRDVRNINVSSAQRPHLFNKNIWNASKQYFNNLYDNEYETFKYVSQLYYFDNEVLSKIPKNKKIIHLWSFAANEGNYFDLSKLTYNYRFKNGVEIRPSLMSLALLGNNINKFDTSKINLSMILPRETNHLEGNIKNEVLAKWISFAINNYELGKLIDYTTDVQNMIIL